MSLQDLAGLVGLPGLEPAVAALFRFYESIENIKVYKNQCKRLHGRCVEFLITLRHNEESFFGTNYQSAIDQASFNFEHIARKVELWSKWGSTKSWTRQSEIKQGLDELNRDLVQCATRFNMVTQMENFRISTETGKVLDSRHAEIEEKLHQLLESTKDIRQILTRPETEIADQMLSIQQAIHEDVAEPETLHSLRERLLSIHRNTELLPPLIDLTGEVRRTSDDPDISGGFSDVYLGEWLGNEKVALKMTRGINQTPNAQRRFLKEVGIWRQLQHKNVEKLYGVATLGTHIYTVSPWMENRDAVRYIKNNPRVDRLKILVEVAAGLEFLHRHRVVHGDLRAANILISKDEIACITDFGLSIILEEEVIEDASSNSTLDMPGNSRWMAPELINPELINRQTAKRNPATDVWSYGMLCLEVLTGQRPFPDRPHGPAVISDLITGVRPTRPSAEATLHGLSDGVWELMQKCWHQNPQLRPSMSEIVRRMQVFWAARVANSSTLPSKSLLVPIPEDSKDPEEAVGSSGSSSSMTPTTSSSHLTAATNHKSASGAQKSSGRPLLSSTDHPMMSSRIQAPGFAPQPSLHAPNSTHVTRSASIDIVPPRRKQSNVVPRPWTAPNKADSGPPRLPGIGEMHNEVAEEGFAEFLVLLQQGFTDPGGIPIVRVENPPAPEELLSTSLPISLVIPEEQTLRRPAPDIPPSEGSGISSINSELSPTSTESVNSPGKKTVYIKSREDGTVEAANLPGLVERLILDSNDLRMDIKFREIFLTSYQAFTDAETVFSLLLERFEAVSSPTHSPEQRTRVRYSVIAVLDLWLRGHHVESKDVPLLYRMREFALSIQAPTAAPTLKGSASKLTQVIDNTVKAILHPIPRRTISSSSSARPSSEMTPVIFARALTELESKLFKNIIPSDCIGWLKKTEDSNGVTDFIAENNKISYWVQRQILKPDDQSRRSENLKYFLYVAEECRKLRNFSSTCAIFAGLASSSVTGLKRTSMMEREDTKLFQDLEKLMSQDRNFQAYRQALNASQAPCVPSLRVHLHDLKVIHGSQRTFIKRDGHKNVINFDLYHRVYERIRHILSYQDPPPKSPIGSSHLDTQDLIEGQLGALIIDDAFRGWLQQRASKLAQEEQANFVGYLDELKAAGFRR